MTFTKALAIIFLIKCFKKIIAFHKFYKVVCVINFVVIIAIKNCAFFVPQLFCIVT